MVTNNKYIEMSRYENLRGDTGGCWWEVNLYGGDILNMLGLMNMVFSEHLCIMSNSKRVPRSRVPFYARSSL